MKNLSRRLERLTACLMPAEEEVKIWQVVSMPSGEVIDEISWSSSGNHLSKQKIDGPRSRHLGREHTDERNR